MLPGQEQASLGRRWCIGLENISVFLGCPREPWAWVWSGGNTSKRGDALGSSLARLFHSLSTLLNTCRILFSVP